MKISKDPLLKLVGFFCTTLCTYKLYKKSKDKVRCNCPLEGFRKFISAASEVDISKVISEDVVPVVDIDEDIPALIKGIKVEVLTLQEGKLYGEVAELVSDMKNAVEQNTVLDEDPKVLEDEVRKDLGIPEDPKKEPDGTR